MWSSDAPLGPLWETPGKSSGSYLELLRRAVLWSSDSLWALSVASLGAPLPHLGASCAEPSEARLRAADACMISLIIVRAMLGSNGEGKLQSASLLGRAVTRCFVFIPLARFPFLLSQVFVFVVKHMENNTFLKIRGPIYESQMEPSGGVVWAFSGGLWGISGSLPRVQEHRG